MEPRAAAIWTAAITVQPHAERSAKLPNLAKLALYACCGLLCGIGWLAWLSCQAALRFPDRRYPEKVANMDRRDRRWASA